MCAGGTILSKIAVLIPCYNESRTIAKVVKDYKEALPEATVYVYDNNSTDDTAKIAKEAGAVVRHEYSQGKGNVIRRMFMEIEADCYIMVDGDDTYPAGNARQMCEAVIERQADMRVRTVAKKSILKVKIIQAIDRQIALDDIATAQGLEFEELLDEVEAIVYSGTKLNIDYFLEEVMDEDHVDDIYDYFADSESDSLEEAINELGGECTEEEIRLVRIKFISDMAN